MNRAEAYRMGGLAAMDQYDPDVDFAPPRSTFAQRFPEENWTLPSPPPERDASEAAAYRLARPYAKANLARMGENPLPEYAESMAPKEPWQWGMMLAAPGSSLVGQGIRMIPPTARALGAAAAFILQPGTAEADRLKLPRLPTDVPADLPRLHVTPKMGELFDLGEGTRKGAVANWTLPDEVAAPAIISRQEPTAADIAAIKAAAARRKDDPWPDAPPSQQVFKTTPEAYAETTELVPQVSVKSKLPGPLPGETLPAHERAAQVVWNTDQIAEMVANRLRPFVKNDSELLKFYHTGPVIKGLGGHADMSVAEANDFMRQWAGQGAATSPRTKTPRNLRNSSFLMFEDAQGNPMTLPRWEKEGNQPGFPMMGMHVNLADQFRRGVENPWTNPKPFTFRENWSGNLSDVTGDTHNIRGTLFELDRLTRSLPPGYFTSPEAYQRVRAHGFRSIDPGDIKDTLEGRTVDKAFRQSEYLPMVEPWYRAAQMLNIKPAEAQSGGWFSYGPITGLRSPPKTITNLLNDQIAATAQEIGVSPEKVASWWARGKIPLAGIGGAGVLGAGMMGGTADQSNYQPGGI